ncbi:MAG: hypothetical protein U0457_11180 [Candidatus Sericytochromatia bacterium]
MKKIILTFIGLTIMVSCTNETAKTNTTNQNQTTQKKDFNLDLEINKSQLDLKKDLSIIIFENDIKIEEIIIEKAKIDNKINLKTSKLEKGKKYKVNLSGGANDDCNIASSSVEITADESISAKVPDFSFTEKFCPKPSATPSVVVSATPVATPTPSPTVDPNVKQFTVKDVKPIMESRCTSCHSTSRRTSGIALDTDADIIKNASRINREAVLRNNMPPNGSLDQADKDIIKKWIEQGSK